jgi:hypothetical protein
MKRILLVIVVTCSLGAVGYIGYTIGKKHRAQADTQPVAQKQDPDTSDPFRNDIVGIPDDQSLAIHRLTEDLIQANRLQQKAEQDMKTAGSMMQNASLWSRATPSADTKRLFDVASRESTISIRVDASLIEHTIRLQQKIIRLIDDLYKQTGASRDDYEFDLDRAVFVHRPIFKD